MYLFNESTLTTNRSHDRMLGYAEGEALWTQQLCAKPLKVFTLADWLDKYWRSTSARQKLPDRPTCYSIR